MFALHPKRVARKTLLIFAITVATGCSAQVTPASTPTLQPVTLRLFATTPTIPLVNDLAAAYARVAPNVGFEVSTGSYESVARRVAAAEQGGGSAYYLTNHLPPEADAPDLWAAPLGIDGLAIIVPREQTVASLTLEQLRLIYGGTLTRWEEVGGSGEEILPISRERGSGTRAEFESLVFGNTVARLARSRVALAPSSVAMLAAVGRTEGALGYISMGYLSQPGGERVRAVPINEVALTSATVLDGTYPLRAYLYIAGAREPMGDLRAFIGWVQSPAGQAVVARHYAPLLRAG